jgi:hypothetical protein
MVQQPRLLENATTAAKSAPSQEVVVDESAERFDIFDVVYHLNKAAELIDSAEQRLLLAKLNLKAATKGKKTLGTSLSSSRLLIGLCGCAHAPSPSPSSKPTTWHDGWRRKALPCSLRTAGPSITS